MPGLNGSLDGNCACTYSAGPQKMHPMQVPGWEDGCPGRPEPPIGAPIACIFASAGVRVGVGAEVGVV